MNTGHGQPIKMAAALLVGGLVAGGLLAAVMPTHMNQQAKNWRDMIGVRKAAADGPIASAIPVYAPPEDLAPIQWQSAAAEYPSVPPQQQSADTPVDLVADTGNDYQPEAAVEALPAELTRQRAPDADTDTGTDTDLAAVDESDAAAQAQGTRSSASDVRTPDSSMTEPATTASGSSAQSQAVSGSA